MKKEYVRIGSTVIFSLILGFAFILANSWFFQHPVEWGVPQSTYLIVMIALFFIDTIAFIFMQLYFIYNRQEFSNCILSLAFLSCLIYFVQTVITVQQPVDSHADISIITNDVAIYYLFRQINLCLLIVLALICKVFENRKQRANRLKKTMLIISLTCLFIVPFV
ncbi:MASE4 domain-containing protein, partial [Escherichia fergusonii]|nr:MASE4 domain-containing protein [Escherichia fergusonii]